MKRKRYSRKFQRMAVERMRTCEDVRELAQELGVTRRWLYKWRTKLETVGGGEEAARPSTHAGSYRKEIQQLKRLLAEKTLEVDFFKGCPAKSRGSTPEEQRKWRDGIYEQIREVMSMTGSLSIERMCELARVSRASFYRSFHEQQPVEEENGDTVCHPTNRHRAPSTLRVPPYFSGIATTGQRKSFVVTTNSDDEFEVYLNLAGRMKVTRINQQWVADITYIRLQPGVRLLGRSARRLFAEGGGLAIGSHVGSSVATHGARASQCRDEEKADRPPPDTSC